MARVTVQATALFFSGGKTNTLIFTNASLHKSRQIDKLRSARTASVFLSLQYSEPQFPF